MLAKVKLSRGINPCDTIISTQCTVSECRRWGDATGTLFQKFLII
jgi:hypothetical protein